ncbi:MAG: hypothetical protein LBB72_09285 [Spirochaetaceae bacterium]|jgi:hypothetical protein|nr:hypothetical protein [Spirochaetaceae bacterium]
MAKQKEIYAPGELAKTRERLGNLDKDEAKRMTHVLGGEIGYERSEEQGASLKTRKVRNETVEVNIGGRRPSRHVDIAADEDITEEDIREYRKRKAHTKKENPADDPSVALKPSYWDRVKMDKYCGQPEFEIKNSTQIMISVVSILNDPVDYVNPSFVLRRMNNYYKRIELLVTAVRTLLPRNNLKRNERFRKASPFSFAVLDTIRYWNIDQISTELSRIQARPRSAKATDFIEILRNIYKPLYILEQLDPETHIKGAFSFLYKLLYIENPSDEAKNKYQELTRTALFSFGVVRRDIRFQLYPLLMKLVSHCYLPYETFFKERENRLKAFLQVSERNQISPQMENAMSEEKAGEIANETGDAGNAEASVEAKTDGGENSGGKNAGDESVPEEEQAKTQPREMEGKALERGLSTLEALFPNAGWNRLNLYPDLYPYFSDVFSLKKEVVLIAPTDPIHQAYFLARILEEIFFGLRYTVFGIIIGPDGSPERLDEPMSRIINQWQNIIESGFEKEYLSRLTEYCQMLENAAESRTSNYAKRLTNDLRWVKRLYVFPYYHFDSIMTTPIQKNSITALYPEVRSLRRYLSAVAAGIEQGNRRGGVEKRTPCDGISNPWDPYVFQVPNPVSTRLDMLLAPKKRNNASLVFFALAVTIVLDYLLNDENSWAYDTKTEFFFRSENGEGVRPLFGMDTKIDTEMLFKQAFKKRQAAAHTEAVK